MRCKNVLTEALGFFIVSADPPKVQAVQKSEQT